MLGFNNMSTLVGHFVSSPRGRDLDDSGLMAHQPIRVICVKMVL